MEPKIVDICRKCCGVITPPLFLRSSFPTVSGWSLRQHGGQHNTDSCDWLTTEGGKMEHRDADFNILLATDSYKVQYKYRRQGNWPGPRAAAGRWTLMKSRWFHHRFQGHLIALLCHRFQQAEWVAGRGGVGWKPRIGVPKFKTRASLPALASTTGVFCNKRSRPMVPS